MKEAFEEQHFPSTLYFADGPSVLSYLKDIKDDAQLPKLIVIDINMPVITVIELLTILKADVRFQHIKVIVFSTTNKVEHQRECTRLGALEFLQKPISFSELRKLASHFMYQ